MPEPLRLDPPVAQLTQPPTHGRRAPLPAHRPRPVCLLPRRSKPSEPPQEPHGHASSSNLWMSSPIAAGDQQRTRHGCLGSELPCRRTSFPTETHSATARPALLRPDPGPADPTVSPASAAESVFVQELQVERVCLITAPPLAPTFERQRVDPLVLVCGCVGRLCGLLQPSPAQPPTACVTFWPVGPK